MYTIYLHMFPHGKVYIGLTKSKPEKRWANGKGYKNNPHMDNAIKKWGWENVDHDIIGEVETLEEAERLERYCISFFNSTDPKNGYNILAGGNVSQNIRNEETRYKMGRAWRGKHHTEEQRRKISSSIQGKLSGEKHPMYGKRASDETRKKQSEAQRRSWEALFRKEECSKRMLRVWTDEAYREKQRISRSKRVGQYDKNGTLLIEYPSLKVAGEATGVDSNRICACCNGRRKSAGGFVWKHLVEHDC